MKGRVDINLNVESMSKRDIVSFANLYDLLVLSTKDKGYNVLVVCSKERKVVKKKRSRGEGGLKGM
jgi:hypothetical protein